jgi:hypothetical protein
VKKVQQQKQAQQQELSLNDTSLTKVVKRAEWEKSLNGETILHPS